MGLKVLSNGNFKAAKDAKRNAICITGLNLAIAAQNVEQLVKLVIRRKMCKKVCTNEKNGKSGLETVALKWLCAGWRSQTQYVIGREHHLPRA